MLLGTINLLMKSSFEVIWLMYTNTIYNFPDLSVKVLRPYTCFDGNYERCSSQDFISSSEYGAVDSYTSSIQNLLTVYPSMEHLLGCQLVKDAFSQVLLQHCKPLKKFARMTWLGMVCLAAIMVLLVVIWTIKARHEHSYHVSDGSVQPHSVTGNV